MWARIANPRYRDCEGCKQKSGVKVDFKQLQQAQVADLNAILAKAKKGKAKFKEYKAYKLEDLEKAIADEDSDTDKPATAAAPAPLAPLYFYHPDHLGTSTALTDFNGNAYQFFLNLPFGETMAEQSGTQYYQTPYKFNGKELDEETGLYYYGARYYDPKVSIWYSVDPLAEKFPNVNPYVYCDNNPVNVIDPDGRSGEPVINKKNGTITVTQHLVFYGGKANSELSGKIATGISAQWNGAHGKVKVDGKTYKVKFKVTYETVSEEEATNMASGNTDIKNNFIRVEDGKGSSFTESIGANSFYFNTDDDLGGSTTPAHEIGHGLGLHHTDEGGQLKTDVPDIMEARGTQVNPRWSKKGPSNEIDPNFRRVDKKEVQAIFKGVHFDKNGKGKIGTTTNKIYDKDGH